MTNTDAWDRLAARSATVNAGDSVRYGPDGPTERDLRLLGEVRGKRVLDLGCGDGQAAVALAKQGAVAIAVDASAGQLARARDAADDNGARVEWHHGDLADLAFLRADSVDAVFSAFAIGEVDDLPRMFRQVQRVLRPNAPFVFSYEHPLSLCANSGSRLLRAYLDTAPVTVTRDGEALVLYPRAIGTVFVELQRAGFRVDTILEPPPPNPAALIPSTVVWRARKEGS
jgi:SAM-dependent methyltransferase